MLKGWDVVVVNINICSCADVHNKKKKLLQIQTVRRLSYYEDWHEWYRKVYKSPSLWTEHAKYRTATYVTCVL